FAVHLVADPPPLHGVGKSVAVLGPLPAHRRGRGAVHIFHLLGGRFDAAEAGVDRDVGLGADLADEHQELVDADVVRLDAPPGRVLARRAAVALADAVLPVVAAHEVPAGPAVDRRV